MDAQKKRRRNLLQNIAIVLLTLSAAALFTQTQLYSLHPGEGYLSSLLSQSPAAAQNVSALAELPAPVRIAVTGAYGRYADLASATGDADLSEPVTLLMEALGSAGAVKACSPEDFRAALGQDADYGNSLYYDFETTLPLSILSGLVGAVWNGEDLSARRILLRAEEDSVSLYLWTAEDACFLSSTALSTGTLLETVSRYQLGNAFFAFDQQEGHTALAPLSLFSDPFTPPPTLSVSGVISDPGALMTALSFNPHTNSRYTESSGTEVVVEGDRTLRIRPDGTVFYQGGSGALQIPAAADLPSSAEQVVGTYQLLTSLFSHLPSSAGLYLESIQTSGVHTTLLFGYQSGGLPIRFADGSAAAEVTLEGASVVQLKLRLRYYTAQDSAGLLLPLTQALSIARSYPGRELGVYYVDAGSSAAVQWLAD